MKLKDKKIGFVMTGSFYYFRKTIDEIKNIVKLGANVIPIMSEISYTTDTRYGNSKDFINDIEKITSSKIGERIVPAKSNNPAAPIAFLIKLEEASKM